MSCDAFPVFPLRGQLETRDFLLLGDLIAAEAALRPSPRILLDWSRVTSWTFRKPSDRQLRTWREQAARVDRLAIVHDSVGNRQAALLGALLRERRCRVRSYRTIDRNSAIGWLKSM